MASRSNSGKVKPAKPNSKRKPRVALPNATLRTHISAWMQANGASNPSLLDGIDMAFLGTCQVSPNYYALIYDRSAAIVSLSREMKITNRAAAAMIDEDFAERDHQDGSPVAMFIDVMNGAHKIDA